MYLCYKRLIKYYKKSEMKMKVGDLVRRLTINGTRFGKETCIGLIVEENGGGYKIKWHEKKFASTWSSHHSLEVVSEA
mgnify:CR=1 FL=1